VSFLIKLPARGLEFECSSEQTLLQAATEANILMPHGCRAGQCGRCKSRLLEGAYFYSTAPYDAISDQETKLGLILCCQARPVSDMTIDSCSENLPDQV